MIRRLGWTTLLLPFLLLSCSNRFHMDGDGLRIDIQDTEIQREIDKAGGFPVHKGVAPFGQVVAHSAKLLLVPSENAAGVSVPVTVTALGKSWSGRIDFSAVPAYEKETGIVYLHEFTVRSVEVPGLSKEMAEVSSALASEVLQRTIKRYDVHKLDPKKTGEWMAKLVLKDIQVRENAVSVHLGL
jgi:hypothetical protein